MSLFTQTNAQLQQSIVHSQIGVSPFKGITVQNITSTPKKADRTPIKRKKLNFDSDDDRDVSAKKDIIKPTKVLQEAWNYEEAKNQNISLFPRPSKDLSKSPLLEISRHSTFLANEISSSVYGKQSMSLLVPAESAGED